jgi:hypothetical protein
MKKNLTYSTRNQSDLHLGVVASLDDALKWFHLIELWCSSFDFVSDVLSLRAVRYGKVGDNVQCLGATVA